MRFSAAAWATASLCLGLARGGGHPGVDADAVTQLTEGGFEEWVTARQKEGKASLVMFHVAWCKVCQKTFPKFAASVALIRETEVDIELAHVDCEAHRPLCQARGVKSYPTIQFLPGAIGAQFVLFRGQRTEEGFLDYARRMTQPAVAVVDGREALEKAFFNESFASFLAWGEGEVPQGLRTAAATLHDRHRFVWAPRTSETVPAAVATLPGAREATLCCIARPPLQWQGADGASAPPAVNCYAGSLEDTDAVMKFVNKSRFPGIWLLSHETFSEFTHSDKSVVVMVADIENTTAAQESEVRAAAARWRDDYYFGVLDGKAWGNQMSDLNIYEENLPRILVIEDNFQVWIEDVEQLRVESLSADLQALADGADILRQERSGLSRLLFWKRAGLRFARSAEAYARQGPRQACLVGACTLLALLLLGGLGKLLQKCCGLLLLEEYTAEPLPPPRDKKTR